MCLTKASDRTITLLLSLVALFLLLPSASHAAETAVEQPAASASVLPAKAREAGVPQGIVVRTTENVTSGGWVWLLNQCEAHAITRIDLLVKQDEDNFQSPRTGRTLQSGELLVTLPGETTADGWENSDWLREMLARAKEKHIEVWAWWPCFHDSQMAAAFPEAAYTSGCGEKFVDPAVPEVQARQEELLAKLISTYPFDGVSLDWLRYNTWEDGSRGPAGAAFARKYDFKWQPGALDNNYSKARWYEARATVIADWVRKTAQAMRQQHPEIQWGAFVLPPQFTETSQSYPLLGRAGLDYLQPMGYWTDWKKPPQWVGNEVVAPFSRALTNGTSFWPVLGIDSPAAEIPVALEACLRKGSAVFPGLPSAPGSKGLLIGLAIFCEPAPPRGGCLVTLISRRTLPLRHWRRPPHWPQRSGPR